MIFKASIKAIALMVSLFLIFYATSIRRQYDVINIISMVTKDLKTFEFRPCLNILLVGDESFSTYNIGETLDSISSSNHNSKSRTCTETIAEKNLELANQINNKTILRKIKSGNFDYVIIKDNKKNTSLSGYGIKQFFNSVEKLSNLVYGNKSKMLLFIPWPAKPNSDFYKDNVHLASSDSLYSNIYYYHKLAADDYDIETIDVGSVFVRADKIAPNINLYQEDNLTPNSQGSYLTALTLYRYFFNNEIDRVSYIPKSIHSNEAKIFLKIINNSTMN